MFYNMNVICETTLENIIMTASLKQTYFQIFQCHLTVPVKTKETGILSTKLLYFARDNKKQFYWLTKQ